MTIQTCINLQALKMPQYVCVRFFFFWFFMLFTIHYKHWMPKRHLLLTHVFQRTRMGECTWPFLFRLFPHQQPSSVVLLLATENTPVAISSPSQFKKQVGYGELCRMEWKQSGVKKYLPPLSFFHLNLNQVLQIYIYSQICRAI